MNIINENKSNSKMQRSSYINRVFDILNTSRNPLQMIKPKIKKNPQKNQEQFTIKQGIITFKILVVDEKPFFNCYYCKSSFCEHIVYLLYNCALINSKNLISLYPFWTPEFTQSLIKQLRGNGMCQNEWNLECHKAHFSILSEIECAICQEPLSDSKLNLSQCSKCLKPIHSKCLSQWCLRHKKEEQLKLKCLYCQQ